MGRVGFLKNSFSFAWSLGINRFSSLCLPKFSSTRRKKRYVMMYYGAVCVRARTTRWELALEMSGCLFPNFFDSRAWLDFFSEPPRSVFFCLIGSFCFLRCVWFSEVLRPLFSSSFVVVCSFCCYTACHHTCTRLGKCFYNFSNQHFLIAWFLDHFWFRCRSAAETLCPRWHLSLSAGILPHPLDLTLKASQVLIRGSRTRTNPGTLFTRKTR